MAEQGVDIPRRVLGGIKKLLSRNSEARPADDRTIRTSEIQSFDGLLSVGDSMRKMEIKESAKEEGRLVEDGDAPQFIGKRHK